MEKVDMFCNLIYSLKEIRKKEKEVLNKMNKYSDPNIGQFYKVTTLALSKNDKLTFEERIYLVIRLLFLYEYDKSVKRVVPIHRYEERIKILKNIVLNHFSITEDELNAIFKNIFMI